MVTVTRSTLALNFGWHIKSLIETNVVNPNASRLGYDWVYKNIPMKEVKDSELPYVIIDTDVEHRPVNVDRTKKKIGIVVRIEVWSKKIEHKSKIVDSIVNGVFWNQALVDVDGKSLRSNHISVDGVRQDTIDQYHEHPTVDYVDVITVNCTFSNS